MLCNKGNSVHFNSDQCIIKYLRSQKTIATAKLFGKLFILDEVRDLTQSTLAVSLSTQKLEDVDLWHYRLGHINFKSLFNMYSRKIVTGMHMSNGRSKFPCPECCYGKSSRKPFPRFGSRAVAPLDIVHSDIVGPMRTATSRKFNYYVSFIDDFSRMVFIYLLKHKGEVLLKFIQFQRLTTTQMERSIKCLRTDNGGEYLSKEFNEYCASNGIQRQMSTPYTPQQNGVSERSNRTIMEMARSMLAHAQMPKLFWGEAVLTACYIRNRCTSSSTKSNKTPYELWYNKKPNTSHLRVFGCVGYAHKPNSKRSKLDYKADKCTLLGYEENRKCYRLLDPLTKRIIFSRDVIFDENHFYGLEANNDMRSMDSSPLCIIEIPNTEEESKLEHGSIDLRPARRQAQTPTITIVTTNHPPRRSGRQRRPPERLSLYAFDKNAVSEPSNYSEAVDSTNSTEWISAMDAEYAALLENQTWELIERPHGRNIISCKWVYKIKRKADGSIEKFKARLVARGFSQ